MLLQVIFNNEHFQTFKISDKTNVWKLIRSKYKTENFSYKLFKHFRLIVFV